MTVYPEPVWIMHAIIQLGSEPRAFYKIKQAPANSAILQAQTTPSPTRSRMLLFSPWWVGAPEWSPQQLHLTSYLFSLACTPAFGTPFMRISVTLLTRVPSAARPLRGGPGPPSLCAQPLTCFTSDSWAMRLSPPHFKQKIPGSRSRIWTRIPSVWVRDFPLPLLVVKNAKKTVFHKLGKRCNGNPMQMGAEA